VVQASLWRAAIVAGCILAVAVAAWVGHPADYLEADPALAHLLRGMALIKAFIVLVVVGAALWRCGWRLSTAAGAGYVAGSSVMAGSTVLIWQLSHIVAAAVLFHGAALGMLYLGWRER
jgi:formate/nitrite transporter FocA (FNT family)